MNESRVRRRIAVEVLPSAIDHLKQITKADGTKDADRISAIKVALAHTLGPVTSGALGKPAEEITAAEISARITELRGTIDDAMSPETRALDAQARELRRGVAADFEDGNLPSRILGTTARGRDRLPAEAIGPRVTAGETPYRDTMRLVGDRDGTRAAVRDQILADAQNAGALRNQDTLNRFFADRAYAVGDFPDVRAGLGAAGASQTALDQAEAFARAREARYAPGRNTPAGKFTRHDDTGVADAMRGVWKSPRPRISSGLSGDHSRCLKVLHWLCPTKTPWIKPHCRVPALMRSKPR